MEKLKKILQQENEDNYRSFPAEHSAIISHRERLLVRIERAVLGNANIQKKEFAKFCKKHPQYKDGMDCYK